MWAVERSIFSLWILMCATDIRQCQQHTNHLQIIVKTALDLVDYWAITVLSAVSECGRWL